MFGLIKLLILGSLIYVGFNYFVENKSIEETTNEISKNFNNTKFLVAEKLLNDKLIKMISSTTYFDRIECFQDVEYGLSCKIHNFKDKNITADIILYDVMSFGLQQLNLYNLLDLDSQIGIENIEMSNVKILKDYNSILIKTKTSSNSQNEFKIEISLNIGNPDKDNNILATLSLYGGEKARDAIKTYEKLSSNENNRLNKFRRNALINDFVTDTYFKELNLIIHDSSKKNKFGMNSYEINNIVSEFPNGEISTRVSSFLHGKSANLNLNIQPKHTPFKIEKFRSSSINNFKIKLDEISL